MKAELSEAGGGRFGARDLVHAPLLQSFREVVEQCGGNPDWLLREAGIPAHQSEPGMVGYQELSRLLELSAKVLNRTDFGMVLAARQCRDGIEGELGHVMKHARSFGDMLELAVGHSYAHSLASQSWLRRFPGAVLLGHDIVLEGLGATRQVIEQILLVGHLTAERLTGGAVRARRILLRHPRLSPLAVYRCHFGCEVRFGQRVNATLYRDADMAAPILSADPPAFHEELAAVERRFADKRLPLARVVRGTVLKAIEDGDCTGEWVAGQLGLHVRSLHRHLASEGTTFRRIKDEVRRDLAGYYLRDTDLDIRTISARLGFSEQSAFARRARFCSMPRPLHCAERLSDRVKPAPAVQR